MAENADPAVHGSSNAALENSALLLQVLLAVFAGAIVWVLEFGEPPVSPENVPGFILRSIAVYAFIGALVGVIHPQSWWLAGIIVWPVALFATVILLTSAGEPVGKTAAWITDVLAKTTPIPLLASLAASYTVSRIVRARRP